MFTINGKALGDAFKAANQAVLPRSPLPAFTHVRILARADGESVSFIGSNGHVTVCANAEAELDDDVDLCLPADKLNAICGLSADTVTFTSDKGRCMARAGKTRMTLQTLPGDSFPMPKLDGEPKAVFEAQGLTDMIDTVAFAIADAKRVDRPMLRNLWIESDGEVAHLVGADGLTLATNMCSITPASFGERVPAFGIAIPDASAAILGNIGADHFEIYEGHLRAKGGDVQIIVALHPGTYVDWKRIIPNPDQFVTFSRADLATVCPLHRVFDNIGAIRVEQDGRLCSLSIAGDAQSVEADLELKQCSEESRLDAAFVGKQLLRLLSQVKTDDVSISWTQPKEGPPFVYLMQDGSWRGLLMPLRV
ncbi:hypothetical protein [Cupriavidus sp.]|uniref:hypothetical protein n=1 Tax=Cupriavidus sp. TaxID=1873897 RepID=UPI0025B7CACF|nr:hypothetical protein [Cupriavidus sp.]MCA3185985.1 hypothetical protein [Cupriavidus sp.]MCA3193599.1 hypothetical protein [Cupriavidus sp.]MCA3199989.1 hypothetical protein [Cupriavidus sp.]MCA3202002.1 hypothetical protein [Cupriavidus sp.]MCA3235955.1 hypothetical protein [Cupriavidus sp.]